MERRGVLCAIFFAWVCLALPAVHAFDLGAKPKTVEWKLDGAPPKAARGETVNLIVVGTIPDNFHTYSTKKYPDPPGGPMPTEISIKEPSDLSIHGTVTYSTPKTVTDENFPGAQIEEFEKTVTFTIPVRINPKAEPGEHTATVQVKYQMCDAKNCFPPKTGTVEVKFTITNDPPKEGALLAPPSGNFDAPTSASAAVGEAGQPKGDTADYIKKAKSQGLWAYLSVAFVSGALALLTPCVFPMIPITVSFFTKRKKVSRGRALRDAAIYSLGIIFTFIGLGFLFALLLGASGINQFAANPWVNLMVAGIFIGLAGSLFGLYEIQLPSGMLSKLNASASQGDGVGSLLLMGLVFSLTSFTCTVPFVGAVMVAATQGDWLWPFLGMLVFSSVFAAPFFLLALFPAALKSLPKSGGWLNSVKVVMGFLEIAAAMKFLSNADLVRHWGVMTREVFLIIWIALALLCVLYLLGKIRFAHDSKLEKMSNVRLFAVSGFAAIAIYLTTGLFGRGMGTLEGYLPPRESTGLSWYMDLDSALAIAKESKKPIFIDFTGHTCTNCRTMEATIFPLPEVASRLKDYVRVRLYTDDVNGEKFQKMQEERFSTVALPFYVTLTPDNQKIETFDGLTTDGDKFAQFLKSGLAKATLPATAETATVAANDPPKPARKKAVEWEVENSIEAAPAQTVNVHLKGTIPEGWHTYSLKRYNGDGPQPTEITVGPAELISIGGTITHPDPKKVLDKGFNIEIEEFEDSVTFDVPLKIDSNVKPGKYSVKLSVVSQMCNNAMCLPKKKRDIDVTLVVKAPATASTESTQATALH